MKKPSKINGLKAPKSVTDTHGPACRACGWDVRAGAEFCRVCDRDHASAMRKAKLAFMRKRPKPPPIEIDDTVPF